MTVLYISSLMVVLLVASSAVWMIHRAYIHTIDGIRADNKDLRDRLFASKNIPPSGVDLTEKYEARQEREQTKRDDPNRTKKPLGPIEQLAERWKADDRQKAELKNIDATQPRKFIN